VSDKLSTAKCVSIGVENAAIGMLTSRLRSATGFTCISWQGHLCAGCVTVGMRDLVREKKFLDNVMICYESSIKFCATSSVIDASIVISKLPFMKFPCFYFLRISFRKSVLADLGLRYIIVKMLKKIILCTLVRSIVSLINLNSQSNKKRKWYVLMECLFVTLSQIDPCKASKPCQNGATCVNNNGDYNCLCKPGFQGRNCEQGNN